MNRLALSMIVAGLVVATSSASAQVCNGTAPFSAGKMRAGFGVRMPNGRTVWDGEFAIGAKSGWFGGANVSITDPDFAGADNSTSFGGFFGKPMMVDAKKTIELCPQGFVTIGENSTSSFGGMVNAGRTFDQTSFNITPFAGASLHRDDFGTTSDMNLDLNLGVGFVLNKVWTIRPVLNLPLTNNGDSVFGIMGLYNFGGTP
jgi:hypothetical protein